MRRFVLAAVVALAMGAAASGSALAGVASAGRAQPSWPQVGFDGGGSSFNPAETTMTAGNVTRLVPRWKTADLANASVRQFVIGGGRLFVASPTGLAAYSLARCATLTRPCKPQWTGAGAFTEVAYANGVVYAVGSRLSAFAAAGGSSCSGIPKVCRPQWSWADTPPSGTAGLSRIKIADGRLWLTDVVYLDMSPIASHLRAFDIANPAGCASTRCNPVRSISTPRGDFDYALGTQSVAVSDGSDHKGAALRVYDAASGAEQWRSPTTGYFATVIASGTTLFVENHATLRVEAYPVGGGANCTAATPKVCTPTFLIPFAAGNPPTLAATPTEIYVNEGTDIRAFDATGSSHCFGTPSLCQPLATYAITSGPSFPLPQPTIANGVLYSSDNASLDAFDATGRAGCVHATHVCSALWTATPHANGPIEVVGGTLYDQGDAGITAFQLAP